MLTLCHAPRSRSSSIVWLLEELGVDYDIRQVSIRRRDPSAQGATTATIGTRDPANVHPHGKVPALVHDGALIYESAAIVLHLTDAFPDAGLAPAVGAPSRGPYLSWLAYYAGVVEPSFVSAFFGLQVPAGTAGWVPVGEAMGHVTDTLSKGPYMMGEAFSGADILYGAAFALFLGSPVLPRTDVLAGYVDRITARPAYRRAEEKDGTPDA